MVLFRSVLKCVATYCIARKFHGVKIFVVFADLSLPTNILIHETILTSLIRSESVKIKLQKLS